MRKSAFTLAELLIALSIVGVVAVLTVPNVTKNIFKKTNVAKLETTFKTVGDAVTNMKVNERVTSLDDSSLYDDKATFVQTYLKVTKTCGTSPSGCFPSFSSYKTISGDDYSGLDFLQTSSSDDESTTEESTTATYDQYYVLLPSGAALGFFSTENQSGVYFLVDINGTDSPNIVGRDLFSFKAKDDFTLGTSYYDNYDDTDVRLTNCKNGKSYGNPCFSQIQADSWVMDY